MTKIKKATDAVTRMGTWVASDPKHLVNTSILHDNLHYEEHNYL